MRLRQARIRRAEDNELTPGQAELVAAFSAEVRDLGLFRTMLRQPGATKALLPWANYIQSRNDLSPRTKEIVVLRTSYRCLSGYEWSHHARFAREAGLSDAEIGALKSDAGGWQWSAFDRACIDACDEMVRTHHIQDATWAALRATLSEKQMMDLVFTIGQYTQVAMIVNAFGVQFDPGVEADLDLARFEDD
jgi:alkylhydroperoxidase family enzyme